MAKKKTAIKKAPAKKTAPVKKKSAPVKKKAAVKKKAPAKKAAKRAKASKAETHYLDIQKAAYLLAEQDGFRGDPHDYWVAAQRQLGVA